MINLVVAVFLMTAFEASWYWYLLIFFALVVDIALATDGR